MNYQVFLKDLHNIEADWKLTKWTKLSFSTVCTKSAGMRGSENDKIQSYDNVFKSIGGKVYWNFLVKHDDHFSLYYIYY